MNTIPAPIPPLFADAMAALFGAERGARLCEALDTPPQTSVRLNSRKRCLTPLFGDGTPVPWCADARWLDTRPLFTMMPEMHAGGFYVQEAASTVYQWLAGHVAAMTGHRPLRVLDLCAAPGGKTTAMLNALPDGSVVMANEHSPLRAKVLAENLTKYGYPSVLVTRGDGRAVSGMAGMFDLVTVDAPCSGEGMMRREEVARTQWNDGLVRSCAMLQRELLSAAVSALRPGGCLIYSTCTFNAREDEENVRLAMEEFGLVPALPEIPAIWNIPSSLDPAVPALRFIPGETRTEGLFVTVLRRPGTLVPEPADFTPPAVRRRGCKPGRDTSSGRGGGRTSCDRGGAATPACAGWIAAGEIPGGVLWHTDESSVRAVPAAVARLEEALPDGLRVVMAGVEVAVSRGRDLFPAPPLALSTILDPEAFPSVDLDRDGAVRYLRLEPVTLPDGTPRGPVLVRHNGLALGWLKNIGTRANNLWPRDWRIRMETGAGR